MFAMGSKRLLIDVQRRRCARMYEGLNWSAVQPYSLLKADSEQSLRTGSVQMGKAKVSSRDQEICVDLAMLGACVRT